MRRWFRRLPLVRWYLDVRRRLLIADMAEELWQRHGRIRLERAPLIGHEDLRHVLITARATGLMTEIIDKAVMESLHAARVGIDVKEYGRGVRYDPPGNPRVNA